MNVEWRKSSYTADQGNCVEAASGERGITVRDSKDPDGPRLVVCPEDWRVFMAGVKAGEFGPA